jgi:hypothetical protein
MDKAERDRLEAQLSDQLGIKVIIDQYCPSGQFFVFNLKDNPYWTDKVKQWVALPADEVFIKSVSEDVKNVIQKTLSQMEGFQKMSYANTINLVSLKSQD